MLHRQPIPEGRRRNDCQNIVGACGFIHNPIGIDFQLDPPDTRHQQNRNCLWIEGVGNRQQRGNAWSIGLEKLAGFILTPVAVKQGACDRTGFTEVALRSVV